MTLVLLDNRRKLLVLSADLINILRVNALLGEVDEDAPSPVLLLLSGGALTSFDRHFNHPSWDKVRADILWLHDDFADLSLNLELLLFEFLLLSDKLFIRDLKAREFSQTFFKTLF